MKHSAVLKTHLERISKLTEGKSLSAQRYTQEVRRMANAVEALERLSLNRSPRDTEEAHAVKIAAAAKRLGADFSTTGDRLNNSFREAVTTLDAQIREQAGLIPSQYSSEIRQSFRSMDSQQRGQALQKALGAGDSEIFAAIQDAPEVVTGIQPEFRDRLVESLQRKKAPDLMVEYENVYESFTTALTALGSVQKAVSEGFDPVKLAEIEAAEASHLQAQTDFNSNTG